MLPSSILQLQLPELSYCHLYGPRLTPSAKIEKRNVHKTAGIRRCKSEWRFGDSCTWLQVFSLNQPIISSILKCHMPPPQLYQGLLQPLLGLAIGWLLLSKVSKVKLQDLSGTIIPLPEVISNWLLNLSLNWPSFLTGLKTGIDYSVQFSGKFFYGFSTLTVPVG